MNIYKDVSRDEQSVSCTSTKIWHEEADPDNPYIASQCFCHGYNLYDLMAKHSYVDMLYLLFRGHLPNKDQSKLFESLIVAMINPGPRHPATRAAMNAGIGKSDVAHILPIGLAALSGSYLGGTEVTESMRFLIKNIQKDPKEVAMQLLDNQSKPVKGDWHIAAGFGSRFNSIDLVPNKIAELLGMMPGSDKALDWGNSFVSYLQENNLGWLNTGVTAAVLVDLGFHPRMGAGLFQLICAPGMLAHGIELSNKPRTAMVFIDQDHYYIENNKNES